MSTTRQTLSRTIGRLEALTPNKSDFIVSMTKYYDYSAEIKEASGPGELIQVLNKMLDENLYPDEYIIGQLIKELSASGFHSFATTIFEDAVVKGMANAIAYNTMINAAGKRSRMDIAEVIYRAAIRDGKATFATYNTMINIAGLEGKMELAEEAYRAAIHLGLANRVTYNSMIKSACLNKQMDLAREALNTVVQLGLANDVTYSNMKTTVDSNRFFNGSLNPNAPVFIPYHQLKR